MERLACLSVFKDWHVEAESVSTRDLSSAGRASALQAEGHRFEPYRSHLSAFRRCGEIAQLARAHGSYPWCQEFESLSRYCNGADGALGFRPFLFTGGG